MNARLHDERSPARQPSSALSASSMRRPAVSRANVVAPADLRSARAPDHSSIRTLRGHPDRGAPVQVGVRSSDAAKLRQRPRTSGQDAERSRQDEISLSGRFLSVSELALWLGELEAAPLAPPELVVRIVDSP